MNFTAILPRVILGLGLTVSPAALHAQSRKPSPYVEYRVNRHDTLYDLARRYFADPGAYGVVQRLNRVADPRRMPIGLVLKIPRTLLRQEPITAAIQSLKGNVRVGMSGGAVGMMVHEGDLVETGERSFVSLRLPDDTIVSLPSKTRIRVQRLRRTLLSESVERQFAVQYGRASGTVTPMTDPASSFEFITPRAITSVRGTHFRVGYDPGEAGSRVEVVEGKVGFQAGNGKEQLVQAGFGSDDRLPAPMPLLPPPELAKPDEVQNDERLSFPLRPMAGATGYHLQIARDAGFIDIIDEAFSESPLGEFPALANGTYFVRLTGIDASGLEGKPSTYSFQRRLNRLRTSLEQSRVGRYRQFLFRWQAPDVKAAQYRFQLSRAQNGSDPVVDQTGLADTAFIITDLPDGTYYWRVMSIEASGGRVYTKWSATNELRVGKTK